MGEGFEQRQVVGRRDDRDVAHGGSENRQLGLRVAVVAIPVQQHVQGMGVAQVVQARCAARRVADAGGAAEALEPVGQPVPGIGLAAALAIGQQGCLRVVRELAPRGQVTVHCAGGLANLLVVLNLLAFAFHSVLDCLRGLWHQARALLVTRRDFFRDVQTLTKYAYFPHWTALLETLLEERPLAPSRGPTPA